MIRPQSVYILGGGGHAKVVIQTLRAMGHSVAAVFDDDRQRWGTTLLEAPIVGPTPSIEEHPSLPSVIAVGDNCRRKSLAERFSLEWMTLVHPHAYVDATVRLGEGTVVLAGAIIQPDTIVGNHVIINTAASVDHDCVVEDFVHVAPGARLAGEVTVGKGCLLGVGVVVIPRISIGAWTTVGAGAAVVRDLPDHVVATGVPARVARPSEHGRALASIPPALDGSSNLF
jgi:sugar O-acyltransferase (sialic acid O-acetyltransferase NeuD family)